METYGGDTFGQRYRICGTVHVLQACRMCEGKFPRPLHGARPRKWCSKKCSDKAYRQRRKERS